MDVKKLKQALLIEENLLNSPMRFYTTWGLFSPREIDAGSHLLLKHLTLQENDKILDLGCGYGALGLTLAKHTKNTVVLVDKDFVAVEYTEKNIKLNHLENCKTFLSNGFSHVQEKDFSLIVSNLPAKVGNEMFYIFLLDAKAHMQVGARIYVVTISGLREFIKRVFKEIFGNYTKVKQGKDYTVSLAVVE